MTANGNHDVKFKRRSLLQNLFLKRDFVMVFLLHACINRARVPETDREEGWMYKEDPK